MWCGWISSYENCKCRKHLVDKLVGECSENEMIYNGILNNYENVFNSCTAYIVLFVISNSIIIGISSALIYFHWYLFALVLSFAIFGKSSTNITNFNPGAET